MFVWRLLGLSSLLDSLIVTLKGESFVEGVPENPVKQFSSLCFKFLQILKV